MVIHATTSNAAIVCQATQQRLRTTGIGSNYLGLALVLGILIYCLRLQQQGRLR